MCTVHSDSQLAMQFETCQLCVTNSDYDSETSLNYGLGILTESLVIIWVNHVESSKDQLASNHTDVNGLTYLARCTRSKRGGVLNAVRMQLSTDGPGIFILDARIARIRYHILDSQLTLKVDGYVPHCAQWTVVIVDKIAQLIQRLLHKILSKGSLVIRITLTQTEELQVRCNGALDPVVAITCTDRVINVESASSHHSDELVQNYLLDTNGIWVRKASVSRLVLGTDQDCIRYGHHLEELAESWIGNRESAESCG